MGARAPLGELGAEATEHHLTAVAAQLAFWALLALFPFAIFVLTLIGYVPVAGLAAEVTGAICRVMPGEAAQMLERILGEIVGRQRGWLLVVSLLGAGWSAA